MGAAEWTGYQAAGSYTPFYDQSSVVPSILPNDGLAYNPSEYHCGSSAQNASSYNGSQFAPLASWPNDVEQYNYGYNGYQYSYPPPTPAQYTPATAPPGQATMVLCPQVYSTVNQNQIHLHLHGSDKLVEQYLGGSNAALQPDTSPFSAVISNHHRTAAIEMSENALISSEDENSIKQHQEQSVVDPEAGDQGVWRPY
jgi:hypothetical protein